MKLPWLRETWNQLVNSGTQNRLSHALGMEHKPALGSDKLLETLVSWLICQSAEKKSQPCKRCKSCLLFLAGTHPDIRRLKPESGRTLGVDEIRLLQSALAQSTHQGGVKIAVIEQAEKMTVNAANALLKTLEEPAGDTYLILTVRRFDDLLPTIRSRLQVYSLFPPGEAELAAWLSQYSNTTVSASAYLQPWRERPLDALKRLEQAGENHSLVNPAEVLDTTKESEQWLIQGTVQPVKDMDEAIELLDKAEHWLVSSFEKSTIKNDNLQVLNEVRRVRHELRSRSGLNIFLALQYLHSQLQSLHESLHEKNRES